MNKHGFILILFFSGMAGHPGFSQTFQIGDTSVTPSEDEKVLQELTDRAKRNLFVMLRVGQEILTETGQQTVTTERARILNDGIPVYSSQYDTTSLIEYINRDETYYVLERQPGYLRIQLDPGKEGWINAGSAFVTGSQPINKTLEPLSNNTAQKVEVIHRLFTGLDVLERNFEKASKAIANPSDKSKTLIREFKRYLTNARNYYQAHFADFAAEPPQYANAINKFSGELALAKGSSTFRDEYSEFLREEFKGSLTDFSLKGLYRMNQSSSVDLLIDTRSELLETPFKSNNYKLGFRRNLKGNHFSLGAGINQYKDSFRGINSYDRLGVNARIRQSLNQNNALSLQYQLVRNNYESEASTDYSRHHVTAGTESRLKNNNIFMTTFRGNLSTSDKEQLNFFHVLPSITYRKVDPNSSTDYTFSFESFSYEGLTLRNSIRGNFGIKGSIRKELGKIKQNEMLLSYIAYPENPNIDHAKISLHTGSHNFIGGNKFSTFGITTKYFLSNANASYADLRYDAGATGKIFTQLSLFDRLYYPEETVLTLLEANFKLGFQIEGFKIGPVLSVRGTVDFNDFSVEADGNYFRIGAFIEGAETFKNGLRLALNGAYDYGNVYSEDISIDPVTGLINAGEVLSRNPTTLRFSFQAGYTLMQLFDLFATADYYKIDRDHKTVSGLNPILSSDRLSFKIGFMYRYN
jgi:hypothetical protein